MAGAALREGVYSFSDFRSLLTQDDKDALEFAAELGGQLPNREEKSVATVLLCGVGLLSEAGKDVLRLASVLAPAPIPTALITAALRQVDDLDEVKAKAGTSRALNELSRYSLVEAAGDGFRTVHTLASRAVRFYDEQPERTQALREATTEVLTTAFLNHAKSPKAWMFLETNTPHARKLVREAVKVSQIYLLGGVAQFEHARGSYVAAKTDLLLLLNVSHRVLGERHPDTLIFMNNLGETLWMMGELSEARRLHEKAMVIRQEVLGERHELSSKVVDRPEGQAAYHR